jgi:hypothetical protein
MGHDVRFGVASGGVRPGVAIAGRGIATVASSNAIIGDTKQQMVAVLVATGGADQRHDRRIGHFASASGSGCMGRGWRAARTESRVRKVTPINELR